MTHTIDIMNRANSRRMAQRFAEDAACGLLNESRHAVTQAALLIAILRGCGASAISVGHVKDALMDALSDAQGTVDKTLDDEGLDTGRHQFSLAELENA